MSYFLAWTSLFQLLFGLVTLPVLLVPLPQSPPIHIASLHAYFASAFWCTFGYDTADVTPPDMCNHLLPLILLRAALAFACAVIVIFMARRGFSAQIVASGVHVAVAEVRCAPDPPSLTCPANSCCARCRSWRARRARTS